VMPSLVYPNALFVPWPHEKAAHSAIEELLRAKKLEQVLHPVESEFIQPEVPHTYFEIQVMHEARKVLNRVGAILGAQEASIRQTQHALRITCPDYNQNGIEQLPKILDQIENGARDLQRMGIRRQDITVCWHQVYTAHLRTELPAELLYRMSKLGLTLELDWRPAATRRVRYLA
ncbi:MAG: hypothetical protein AAFV07_19620, partial [Bacteroidota bacterium]